MAARGRTAGFQMGAEHRLKITNSNILSVLIQHACGEREMSATQVSAAVALLRKVMPDLSASENKTEVTHRSVMRMPKVHETPDEWLTTNRGLSGSPSPAPKQH